VDTAPKMTVAAYFTSGKLQKEQPDLVKRFTEAANESLSYAQAHPDEARQAITGYTKITKDQVAAAPSGACPR
uniref:ABC transporter substrate-binding protein n=1 Tax=Crossiella equi TaxID=130796 RepID=UPI00117789CC